MHISQGFVNFCRNLVLVFCTSVFLPEDQKITDEILIWTIHLVLCMERIFGDFSGFRTPFLRHIEAVVQRCFIKRGLLKSSQNSSIFLWNLRNFWEHLFYKTPVAASSYKWIKEIIVHRNCMYELSHELSDNLRHIGT